MKKTYEKPVSEIVELEPSEGVKTWGGDYGGGGNNWNNGGSSKNYGPVDGDDYVGGSNNGVLPINL